MKRGRLAIKHHECDECSGVIFPGWVYVHDSRREHPNSTRFIEKKTCALCYNTGVGMPPELGPLTEVEAFWQWMAAEELKPEHGHLETHLEIWRESGSPTSPHAKGTP